MSFGRHNTTVFQALGPCNNKWVSNWPSFQTSLLTNHRLEVTDTEYLPDDLQFCRSRYDKYIRPVLLKGFKPFC